jgi:uncharacterized protein (DUF433 family)
MMGITRCPRQNQSRFPIKTPVEVPLYTPWDVARHLRIPLSAADVLSGRFRGWPEPDFMFRYLWRHPHQLSLLDDDVDFLPGEAEERHRISFRRFADLFVRAGLLHALVDWPRVKSKPPEQLERVHRTIWRGLEDTHRDPVPFNASPAGDRADQLVRPFADRLDEGQTALLRKYLIVRLDRVDVEGNTPTRLYPPTRDPAEKSPRTIVLDPRVRFGRPTVAGRDLPTDSLFERYLAGDSTASLAKDYDLTPGEVEEAIRYESRPPAPLLPFSGW